MPVELRSLNPEDVLSTLDLGQPGLEPALAALRKGDRPGTLGALLDHYRRKYPLPAVQSELPTALLEQADQVTDHVFQWGPYEPADYGKDIHWEWDPRGDIEWVAAVYRFYWALPLGQAYAATQSERYAQAFVELTADWIAKHPLEKRDRAHPVYTSWRGFPWLDIQTGIRATNLCHLFRILVHAKAFTPDFLGVFLASLYDHQAKTEHFPMGMVHNKAIFEQRGFINVAFTFPEFRDAPRWLKMGMARAYENLMAQTTTDGVQREWSGGYHLGVLRDALEIRERMQSVGIPVPEDYLARVRHMADYVFAMATPDLGFPMFGDCARPLSGSPDRSTWPLHGSLVHATEALGDPKYAAQARLDRLHLPDQKSYAFREAGMYVMRSDWGPDQVYLALHCSPPALTSHDQPDNGTFELYAFGRWLMTDSGFYVYGHDPEGRAWHRRTAVHQTLTLDERDSAVAGQHRMWLPTPDAHTLVVENLSCPDLIHRRTVWFVDRSFFVLLDEAIGGAAGTLDLHFQFAPGPAQLDPVLKQAVTGFDDVNVLVWADAASPVVIEEEGGWFSWAYGHRTRRQAFRHRHLSNAPAFFLTVLLPYRGTRAPTVTASLSDGFVPGADEVVVNVRALGREWRLARHLREMSASAEVK